MTRTPETALIDKQTRLERAGIRAEPERVELDAAMQRFVDRFGHGDAAAWACIQATRHTLIANPPKRKLSRYEAEALFGERVSA